MQEASEEDDSNEDMFLLHGHVLSLFNPTSHLFSSPLSTILLYHGGDFDLEDLKTVRIWGGWP